MPKLQKVKSGSWHINIPSQLIKILEWKKGDNLKFSMATKDKIVLEKV